MIWRLVFAVISLGISFKAVHFPGGQYPADHLLIFIHNGNSWAATGNPETRQKQVVEAASHLKVVLQILDRVLQTVVYVLPTPSGTWDFLRWVSSISFIRPPLFISDITMDSTSPNVSSLSRVIGRSSISNSPNTLTFAGEIGSPSAIRWRYPSRCTKNPSPGWIEPERTRLLGEPSTHVRPSSLRPHKPHAWSLLAGILPRQPFHP